MKTETIEEFLARGGKITRVPPAPASSAPEQSHATSRGGPSTIISMDEADLVYGESKKHAPKSKDRPKSKIDLSLLPEELRRKFLNKVHNYDDQET